MGIDEVRNYVRSMCRLAAYIGRPRSLHELWLAPPHGLVVQSYAPREMNGALLNADGFGMAWYTPATDEPALYRSVLPLWGDENVTRMAPHLLSGCALANVRSATPGMAVQASNVSPFVSGRWAFTHNGLVRGWPQRVRRVRALLDEEHYAAIEGSTDSEHLFRLVMTHLARRPQQPAQAIRDAFAELEPLLDGALLNVALTDGRSLVAVCHAVGEPAPSLYLRSREGDVELASEPLDEDGWESVESGTMVIVTSERELCVEAL